jgi:hypothetical protein
MQNATKDNKQGDPSTYQQNSPVEADSSTDRVVFSSMSTEEVRRYIRKRRREWDKGFEPLRREYLSQRDYLSYLDTFHDSGTELSKFYEIRSLITNPTEYGWCLLYSYTNARSRVPDKKLALRLFEEKPGPPGPILLEETDRIAFAKLPQEITLYRGYKRGSNRMGLSWSISKERAIWFAQWFASQEWLPRLVTGRCWKTDVLAYTNCRQEDEIIINPRKIREVRNLEVALPAAPAKT